MTQATIQELLWKADIYRLVSKGFSYPGEKSIDEMKELISELLKVADNPSVLLALEELKKEIRKPDPILNEYSRLFLKGNIPLTESFCCGKYDAWTDVAAFYNAFGMKPRQGDSPDALTYELEFLAILLVKILVAPDEEKRNIALDAYSKFLAEHMEEFSTQLLAKMEKTETIPWYKLLAQLLKAHIQEESALLNLES